MRSLSRSPRNSFINLKSMQLYNTSETYGLVAIVLHWLIASAIIALFIGGKIMVDLPRGSSLQFTVYQLHKSLGITILLLSLLRVWWRWVNPLPALPDQTPAWQKILAKISHRLFYALMILLPLSGWLMVSASPWNIPTLLYGVIPWPHLPVPSDRALEEIFIATHFSLGIGVISSVYPACRRGFLASLLA